MKKVLNIIWIMLFCLLIVLLVNYSNNEKMISKFNNKVYELNKTSSLGFMEPYISYYNAGNVYYMRKDYAKAENQFKKAVSLLPPKGRNSKVRINLALSIATPVNPEYISIDEIDDTVEHLREAQQYLLYKNFANTDGLSGTNRKAQLLYNDIEDLIQKLLQEKEQSENQDQNNQGGQDNQNNQGGQGNQNDQNDQNNQDPNQNPNQDGQDNQNQNGNGQNNPDDQNGQGNENQDQNNQGQNGDDNQNDGGQGGQGNQDENDPLRDQLGGLLEQGAQERNDDLNYDQYMFDYNFETENW